MIKLKKDNEKQKYESPKIDEVVFLVDDVLTASGGVDGYGVEWSDGWSIGSEWGE